MKKFIYAIGILLSLGGTGEIIQVGVNDFAAPKTTTTVTQKEEEDGVVATLVGTALILLQNWQSSKEKRTYNDEFEVSTISENPYDNQADLSGWLNNYTDDFRKIIENEWDDYIRSSLNIISLEFGMKGENVTFLRVKSTMPQLNDIKGNQDYKSFIKKVVRQLLEEKVNHIYEEFVEEHKGSQLHSFRLKKKHVDDAMNSELKFIQGAHKILTQPRKRRKASPGNV